MSAAAGSSTAKDAPSSSTTAPPPQATAYRSTTVDDDDDDDLDDLDDVLESFNAPKSTLGKRATPDVGSAPASATSPAPSALAGSAAGPIADAGAGAEGDDEFEASLVEGMESLLRSLANENPPGPMADAGAPGSDAKAREATPMSAEEEEKAFQRALELMMSGEGMDAMGLGAGAGPSTSARAGAKAPGAGQQLNFEETIKKAMESVNAGGATPGGSGRDEIPGDLAALLKQLGEDPSALDGFGDDDDELGGILDGMMAQLMSKEVLEEPMSELAAKYPGYLEKPPAGVSAADLEKYRKQHELVKQILDVFKRPNYTDDKDGKEVAKLVGEMQDLGGPPNEIMGDLPDGFDLGALGGGDEGCVIM